jgi:hypothetical protein
MDSEESFPGGKAVQRVELGSHLHLVPRLKTRSNEKVLTAVTRFVVVLVGKGLSLLNCSR